MYVLRFSIRIKTNSCIFVYRNIRAFPVSHIEAGPNRVMVIELIELADARGFDGAAAFRRIAKVRD
jgi:hypothetical protein